MASFAAKQILAEKEEGELIQVQVNSASTHQLSDVLKYKLNINIKGNLSLTEWTCDVIVSNNDDKTQKMDESNCNRKSGPLPDIISIDGGYSTIDINDETVKEMASFATTSVISQAINSQEPLTVVRVIWAESQVVAGFNYKMELELKEGDKESINCNVTVFDQSWTQTRQVTDCSCCGSSWKADEWKPLLVTTPFPVLHVDPLPTLHLNEENNKKRPDAPRTEKLTIVGGYSDIEVDDETVNKMAAYAAKELLEMREQGKLKSVKVLSAGIQKLPTTFKYKMSVEIESESSELACEVIVDDQYISIQDDEGKVTTTNTQVLYDSACKPLSEALLQSSNSAARSIEEEIKPKASAADVPARKPLPDLVSIVGGFSLIDTEEEAVKEMASFAATIASQSLNSAEPLSVFRIVSARRQVVAGFNYDLELELKDGDKSSDEAIKCKVIVFDQSWTNTREMSECSCCGPSKIVVLPSIVSAPKPNLVLPPLPF